MDRMLMVMAVAVFVLGCEEPAQRPGYPRAMLREPKTVTAPASPASRATPAAPTEQRTVATESSRAPSPPPPTGAAGETNDKAAEQRQAMAEKQVYEGISGLVMDETMTKVGREFVELFCLLWEPPTTGLSGYNVLISEKASPMWGALITVSVDDVPIWGKVLKPRSDEVELEVEEARAIVYEYISNYEQYQMQTEDMTGTGI